MSDLFRYLYIEIIDDENVYSKYYNKLCNYQYGTYIYIVKTSNDGYYTDYHKYIYCGTKNCIIIYFEGMGDDIYVRYYKNNITESSYQYYNKSLHIKKLIYLCSKHYRTFRIYYPGSTQHYYNNMLYNIECYSLKSNKKIFINTKTKQCKIYH